MSAIRGVSFCLADPEQPRRPHVFSVSATCSCGVLYRCDGRVVCCMADASLFSRESSTTWHSAQKTTARARRQRVVSGANISNALSGSEILSVHRGVRRQSRSRSLGLVRWQLGFRPNASLRSSRDPVVSLLRVAVGSKLVDPGSDTHKLAESAPPPLSGQGGRILSFLCRAAPHGLCARSMSSPTPSAAAPSDVASATDHNAPGNLEAGDAGDALSRDHGNLPADEVLPSHENGQAGDAALGADEDATKQVISHPKTRIRTPCE